MSASAVILADGDFPRAGGEARRILEQKGSDLIATVNYHSKETWRQQTE
jgi:hypothetical protein